MKPEEEDLLIQDLCCRLPYGVMVREDTVLYDDKNTTSYRVKKLDYQLIGKGFLKIKGFIHDYEYIYRPYLFPLSSMTEEQYKEYCELEHSGDMEHLSIPLLDWCNKNHFDYRGLIPMGLAKDATNLNIY